MVAKQERAAACARCWSPEQAKQGCKDVIRRSPNPPFVAVDFPCSVLLQHDWLAIRLVMTPHGCKRTNCAIQARTMTAYWYVRQKSVAAEDPKRLNNCFFDCIFPYFFWWLLADFLERLLRESRGDIWFWEYFLLLKNDLSNRALRFHLQEGHQKYAR